MCDDAEQYPPIVQVWRPIPMTDQEYESHGYAKLLEMDRALCPACKAPTKGGICLNGCHLSGSQYRRLLNMGKDPQ